MAKTEGGALYSPLSGKPAVAHVHTNQNQYYSNLREKKN